MKTKQQLRAEKTKIRDEEMIKDFCNGASPEVMALKFGITWESIQQRISKLRHQGRDVPLREKPKLVADKFKLLRGSKTARLMALPMRTG